MNSCCIKTAERIWNKMKQQIKVMTPCATKSQGCARCGQIVKITVEVG